MIFFAESAQDIQKQNAESPIPKAELHENLVKEHGAAYKTARQYVLEFYDDQKNDRLSEKGKKDFEDVSNRYYLKVVQPMRVLAKLKTQNDEMQRTILKELKSIVEDLQDMSRDRQSYIKKKEVKNIDSKKSFADQLSDFSGINDEKIIAAFKGIGVDDVTRTTSEKFECHYEIGKGHSPMEIKISQDPKDAQFKAELWLKRWEPGSSSYSVRSVDDAVDYYLHRLKDGFAQGTPALEEQEWANLGIKAEKVKEFQDLFDYAKSSEWNKNGAMILSKFTQFQRLLQKTITHLPKDVTFVTLNKYRQWLVTVTAVIDSINGTKRWRKNAQEAMSNTTRVCDTFMKLSTLDDKQKDELTECVRTFKSYSKGAQEWIDNNAELEPVEVIVKNDLKTALEKASASVTEIKKKFSDMYF